MKILVIGAGTFGATVAAELGKRKCEVVVIDTAAAKLESIKDTVSQVVVADGKDRDVLGKFAVNMDTVIVSLGEIIDASVLMVLHLRELGVKRIIAKATSPDHAKILMMVGAHQVVNPERDEAVQLANNLVSPNIVDLMEIGKDMNLVELAVPESFYGKTLRELEIRKKFGFNVLAVKNVLHAKTLVMPPPDYCFEADDIMIVIGNAEGLRKLNARVK